MSDPGHEELRRSISSSRAEAKTDADHAREDTRDLSQKLDTLFQRWEDWGDAQDEKFEAFRKETSRLIEGTRGDIASALTGPVQRIEKQFDQISAWRERDLKEMYTMAAKIEAHEKDITAAHGKVRTIDQKVEKLIEDLPLLISAAVTTALKEQEGRALKKTLAWISGIIGAIIAEYIALRLLK